MRKRKFLARLLAFMVAASGMLAAPVAFADPAAAPERSLVETPNADFFGGDYDVLKSVDLNVCQTACLSENRCQAYTFNVKTRWCFLKEKAGEMRSVVGATSGKVVTASAPAEDQSEKRAKELSFLPGKTIDDARRLRLEIAGAEADPELAGLSTAELAARAAMPGPDAIAAEREALKREPQSFAAWQALANTALAYAPTDYDAQQENAALRGSAAVAAYLASGDPAQSAAALALIGRATEASENWKLAIKAYRQSLAAHPSPAVQAALDAAVASHGFRIVDNSVDNNAASPRICLVFSDELAPSLTNSENAGDYLSIEGGDGLSVAASGNQICVDGVAHGQRYRIVARPGILAADGETLTKPADLSVYVRDRDPSVRFATNDYVLPSGGEASIPVTTINTDSVEARLLRIGDRALARTIGESKFLSELSSYDVDDVVQNQGEEVWKGSVDVKTRTNEEVVTAIPVSAIVKDLKPGVYLLSAKAANAKQGYEALATQWFVLTDIGLSSFSGADGLHVFARSLGDAGPKAGVRLDLVAANNEILGSATTDASGYARFPAGLMRGTGGERPAVLTAATGEAKGGDFSFLDLTSASFDLTDRGVEGRPPAGALDIFLTTERGIYRTGETVDLTGLVRNQQGAASEGLTLTGIVSRPDGVEYRRTLLKDEGAGGFAWKVQLPANAMRGAWRFALHTDPKQPALAETTALVDDFEPQKIDFDLATDAKALDPASPPTLAVDARYLFGAPAAGLTVEGETVLSPAPGLPAYPGYRFGLASDQPTATRLPFTAEPTDEGGKTTVEPAPFQAPATTRPLEASIQVRVADANGRPVEKDVKLPLAGNATRLGIKPLFDGSVGENTPAGFDVLAVGPDGKRASLNGASWVLNKVTTRFQWYNSNGRWNYEPVHSSQRVASGTLDLGGGEPAHLSLPVEWGGYELVVKDPSGKALPASASFEAGWYVAAKTLDTPDILKVSLDKPRYRVGDKAIVHIEPRFAGKAEVLVMDERVIAAKAVDIPEAGADVTLDVTRDWGPGAYVAAILYRPMDLDQKRMPGRAIGLAHAAIDPGERALSVKLTLPAETRPRQSVAVAVAVAGGVPGEKAYVTLAAVDVGILNITHFDPPAPSAYYFGKRRLGVEIRDLYGRLIDRMQGAPGTVRSGGDAGASFVSPPPMDQLVSLFSGPVEIGADGKAVVPLDLPDFNGTLKVMAIAWSKTGVGEASADMLVRDPVVVAVSAPHFLAPGDRSRIAIDVTHVEGPTGKVSMRLAGGEGIVDIEADRTADVTLAEKERRRLLIPVTARNAGEASFDLALTLPDGSELSKRFALPVRSIAPRTVTKSRFDLAANGGQVSIGADVLADFMPGSSNATVTVTSGGHFDIAGVVRSLDRYPYGCTEQLTSKALPLVYLDKTILAAGLSGNPDVRERVQKAISGILANQASNGSFGLWAPASGDLWLDAYVTDFLTRASEAGYDVPKQGLTLAIDNLRNTLSYLPEKPDFAPVAYAYYVLARNGRAAIGDLRYYADNSLAAFPTPLAKAQLGAALALYGDRVRAETIFRRAAADALAETPSKEGRLDYGTPLRDGAAVLTLGLEAKIDGVAFQPLIQKVNLSRESQRFTSTQEDAWSLLAAHALLDRSPPKLEVDGKPLDGPFAASYDPEGLKTPVVFVNRGDHPVSVDFTLTGVPKVAPPAEANGYKTSRSYYRLDGKPADPKAVAQGDRLVAVVEVLPVDDRAARLIIDDPLPAGFEIDNPAILKGGDVAALDWLSLTGEAAHVEFRADRFVAALDQAKGATEAMRFAYIVRAVSPGEFVHPAASVEDMYDPDRRGRTAEEHVSILGPRR